MGYLAKLTVGLALFAAAVTAADQQMLERQQLKPNHRSAYDTDMFNKATASLDLHGGATHGD